MNKICISVAKVTNYVDEQPQLRILLHVHTFVPITTMPNLLNQMIEDMLMTYHNVNVLRLINM